MRDREERVTGSHGDFRGAVLERSEPQVKGISVTCQRSPSSIQLNPHQHMGLSKPPKDRKRLETPVLSAHTHTWAQRLLPNAKVESLLIREALVRELRGVLSQQES